MSDVTQMLFRIESGDPLASDELLPLVYDELRKLAAARLAMEPSGQTLQTTALVHEVYLRLVQGKAPLEWENRRHFFAAAAEAMRRILIDQARRKASVKHGGDFRRIDFDDQFCATVAPSDEFLALNDALIQLEAHDHRAAELVKLRYFAGLSHQDAAAAMKISRRTADRLWALSKAWLYQKLTSTYEP